MVDDTFDSIAHKFMEEEMHYGEYPVLPAQHIIDGFIAFTDGSYVIVRNGDILLRGSKDSLHVDSIACGLAMMFKPAEEEA